MKKIFLSKVMVIFFSILVIFISFAIIENYDFGVPSEAELTKQINSAIEKQDYSKAYTLVESWYTYSFHNALTGNWNNLKEITPVLNEKILTTEIADYITEDERGNMSAKIIFTIKQHAKFNNFFTDVNDKYYSSSAEKRMLEYAIEIANTLGKQELVEQLTNAIQQYKN